MDECPACGSDFMSREEVDIGVGTQYGPWHCMACGWQERFEEGSLLQMVEDLEHEEEPF